MINKNLEKMSPPAGLLVRKFFEKNNMVSNDSKLPNSAKKKFLSRRQKMAGNGGPAAAFYEKYQNLG